MKYDVFVSIATGVEVEALNEEDAKKKVYDNLVATKQIKPADYVKIDVLVISLIIKRILKE